MAPTAASNWLRVPPPTDALATWREAIACGHEHFACRTLADTGRFAEQDVNFRWIYVYMIEEYARHNSHVGLPRQRIDDSAVGREVPQRVRCVDAVNQGEFVSV
jgi:hypothetical protein